MTTGPLGRRPPTDFEHVEKYPLRALAAAERPKRAPVLAGVNWYSNFDSPEQDSQGHWWIGRRPDLGRQRGGHAVVLPPVGISEPSSWWRWFDQISEGICVAEAISRAMALLNRKRYQPRPLYDWAQENDEWQGSDYHGTSVRAGLDCARVMGMVPALRGEAHAVRRGVIDRPFVVEDGISANRWATSVEEVTEALGSSPDRGWVAIANSWGESYPRRVRMTLATVARLLAEDGEFGLVTDR